VGRFNDLVDQYLDDAGDPLISGFIKVEESGGGADKDTFADINLTILNANPIPLSAAGIPPNVFFNGNARMILFANDGLGAPGEQIRVLDPLPGAGVAGDSFESWDALVQYDLNDIVKASNERFYKSIANGNIENDPVTTSGFWMETRLVDVFDLAYTYQTGQLVIASDGVIYQSAGDGNIGNDPVGDQLNWTSTSVKVTVTDESTDTTCFPLFVTDAIGDLPPKSGTNLTFNSNTGLLTATLLGGTVNTAIQNTITTMTALVTTGALNSGSITSGFGPIDVGASTIRTTGGIIFNDEALKDYDEALFTPVFADASSGGNVSATAITGRLVRTGKEVVITIEGIDIDTTGLTAGNNAFIRNLPFTSESATGHEFSGSVSLGGGITFAAGYVIPLMFANTTSLQFAEVTSGNAVDFLVVSEFPDDTADFKLTLTYEIN